MKLLEIESKRIQWLDVVKGISIFFVVLVHTLNSESQWVKYASTFFMPLFFFTSGLTFKLKPSESDKDFLTKKIKFLLVPYFSFAMLGIPFQIVQAKMDGSNINFIRSLLGVFNASEIWNGPLWFLPCIFITHVLYFFISKRIKKDPLKLLAIFVLTIVGFLLSFMFEHKLFWRIDTALAMLSFYYLGDIMKYKLKNPLKGKDFFITLIYLFVNLVVGMKFNGLVAVAESQYSNHLYFYISAISGILFYVSLSKIIASNLYRTTFILSYLGRTTMYILCMHWFVLTVLSFVQNNFIPSVGIPLVKTVLTIIILIPIIQIVKRYFNFLYGKSNDKLYLSNKANMNV